MIVAPDSIQSLDILTGLLGRFGITLKGAPAFPVSFQGIIDHLVAQQAPLEPVNALIAHINRSASLFGTADRERGTAQEWPNTTRDPARCVSRNSTPRAMPVLPKACASPTSRNSSTCASHRICRPKSTRICAWLSRRRALP